jgi:hypothetical protein
MSAFGTATRAEGICTWATSDINTTTSTRTMISLFNVDTMNYEENAFQIGVGIGCIKN